MQFAPGQADGASRCSRTPLACYVSREAMSLLQRSIQTTGTTQMEFLDRYTPYALAALRIATALIFIAHGTQKLFGFPAPPASGLPALLSISGIGGILEFAGGLLILIGLFTRPVAFLLSGQMAVAYWMFHAPRSVYPILNGGDAAILYCFIFLLLVFTGPGAWSVDGARSRQAVAR
jgi:putative oxidoreductase